MNEPIQYIERASGKKCVEAVYGESFLRWACEHPFGRLTVAALVKRAAFSKWYGWRMDRSASAAKIGSFIEKYGLERSQFIEPAGGFCSFNEFFYRRLQPGARPVASGVESIVFPADGRHFVFENVEAADAFYVKGQRFDLATFIGDERITAEYRGGAMMISRLCPVDYHRFHFPVSGTPAASVRLSGCLRSVSPIALRRRLSILWENRRERTEITASAGCRALLCEIGATCVGGIHQTFRPGQPIKKGEEKGYFSFGGSCVVTLFTPGTVRWDADLLENSARLLETHAYMGESCGVVR